MIIKTFNLPSEILPKIQESSDLGWREDEEKSIFISSFGNIQIIFNDEKNEIEINPIEETEDGWENMINWRNVLITSFIVLFSAFLLRMSNK